MTTNTGARRREIDMDYRFMWGLIIGSLLGGMYVYWRCTGGLW